jgi:hypothetical protein
MKNTSMIIDNDQTGNEFTLNVEIRVTLNLELTR